MWPELFRRRSKEREDEREEMENDDVKKKAIYDTHYKCKTRSNKRRFISSERTLRKI